MTTFTTLTDTTLSQDKPLTQDIVRALRDNVLAIQEGDVSAPRVSTLAIQNQYFQARSTSTQTIGMLVPTKIQFATEDLDPSNLYNATTNYRFTPNVAGIYHVCVLARGATTGNGTGLPGVGVYKNGSLVGDQLAAPTGLTSGSFTSWAGNFHLLVAMNGTTDYLEGWVTGSVAVSVTGGVFSAFCIGRTL